MKKLENKVAVITGGNSGIGLATAKLFAQHGARLTITGRNEASLREAEAAIGPDTLGLVASASISAAS
jgi:NAD(P)-dependent dehydrogenase (short-subunit alcohol dehydrogenase family)